MPASTGSISCADGVGIGGANVRLADFVVAAIAVLSATAPECSNASAGRTDLSILAVRVL